MKKIIIFLVMVLMLAITINLVLSDPLIDLTEPPYDFALNETFINSLNYTDMIQSYLPEALKETPLTIYCNTTQRTIHNESISLEDRLSIIDKLISASYFIECLG